MKKLSTVALFLLASTAQAGTDVSFGVSSEYVFRGVTQSDGAQVWGSFDYSLDGTGLYSGLWVSNAGLRGNEEVDIYGGYALGLGASLSVDLGAIGYFAPSAPESATGPGDNNAELYLGLNGASWNVYAYYNFGRNGRDEDEYSYLEANYEFAMLPDAMLRIHAGYLAGMGELFDLYGDESYFDYGLTFVKDYGSAGQIALAVTATTIDADHGLVFEFAESDRPQFTVGWSRNFGAL